MTIFRRRSRTERREYCPSRCSTISIIAYYGLYFPTFPFQLGLGYVYRVQELVLKPCNLDDIDVNPSGPQPYTLWYNSNDTSKYHLDGFLGRAVVRTGASYWNMSARE